MDLNQIRYENNIIYTPPNYHVPDPRGVGYVYFECMSKNKDLRAQVDGPTGVEETYGVLLERCIRTAIGMKKKGIKYGDVISLCTNNHLSSCVPQIASMFVGTKIAAIDPCLSLNDASYLLQLAMPKLIFVQPDSVGMIENVVKKIGSDAVIVVFGPSDTHIPFSDLVQPHAEESQFKPVKVRDIRDVAVILFSSGTTGLPKGICHTHYSILRGFAPQEGHDNNSLSYVPQPPYGNVHFMSLHICILTGAKRLIYPIFDDVNPWKIFNYKITGLAGNAKHMLIFNNVEKPENVDTSSLRTVIFGGSPVTELQLIKVRSIFPNSLVMLRYGQTEIFSTVTLFDVTNPTHAKLVLEKKNSSGLPARGIYYKIVDEAGRALGPNEKGELHVKTDMQLSGYCNMDSSSIWDSDGWLKTGDYGYYDEDFCFYIIDRLMEMFKCIHYVIIPAVLEEILQTHLAVHQAVVIGIPHELDHNHPMAFIQLKSSAQNVTAEEIEKYLEDRVVDWQRLRGGVKFVKSYPTAPSGKIMRMKLKNMILQNEI